MTKYLSVTSVALFIFFVSCVPPVYIPNSLNTPLLKGKGEAGVGYNQSFAGHDFQTSYAISNSIGLMINGTYFSNVYENHHRKHKFAELGIGYLSDSNKYFVGEIYIGAGLGSNLINEGIFNLFGPDEEVNVNASYIRLFLQPVFGGYTEILEGGFGLRMCYIYFYKINHSNIDFPREKVLFEPVVFMRLGPPVFKFQTHFGLSFTPFQDSDVFYEEWNFGAGFIVRLNIK
ncbi:hypothetical protein JW879_02880 [candidate division WOR-3 bacterium]|nr:hypothetical protein [candidate division WOR-3 bacterium]